MKSYGQFCPVAKAAELFCERWTPLIIRDLSTGATRFSELKRGVPLMSPTLLSRRLKDLEAEGIIERRPKPKGRGATYHLTEAGMEFVPMVQALGLWGRRWSRRQLADGEIDLGLLIWALERRAKTDAFGHTPSVVKLELRDQPAGKRHWWFVNWPEGCELCLEDPGFDVDLYVTCTLADMIYLMRGDLPISRAIEEDRLDLVGTHRARRALRTWLNPNPLASVKSMHGADAMV